MLKRRKVTQVCEEKTGGAVPRYVTNQSVGMRKGSVSVRGVAAKSLYAVLTEFGSLQVFATDIDREIPLSSSRGKRYAVCCIG